MNTVQPIKDPKQLQNIRMAIKKGPYGKRDLFLFDLACNTGMRISDLLPLKVKDVKDKSHITIHEQKTGKRNEFYISHIYKHIDKYIKGMEPEAYLFAAPRSGKPIDRHRFYRILREAVEYCGYDITIGCHSTRKTFGYNHYQAGTPLEKIQKLFNHSSAAVTFRYIGMEREDLDNIVGNITIGF